MNYEIKKDIKMASRKAFGQALVSLGETFDKIVVLDADLSKSTMSYDFSKKYPQRFFQMGIAEANMLGVASGLALSGYIPFACSFACFITGRFDQIKMSVAYSGANVRVVGTHCGIGIGEDGYSQQGLEDIALMRSLPTMEVFQPSDDIETHKIMQYLCTSRTPAYLRLTRQDLVRVHDESYTFKPGLFSQLRSGNDISIFASGGTLFNALEAADQLAKTGIKARVYNASSIKPVDHKAIFEAANQTKMLFSIEDHNIIGGLGGAIAESLSSMGTPTKLIRLGIQDEFGESGTPESLYEKHGLSSGQLYKTILGKLH